jgi:hypothetical protein
MNFSINIFGYKVIKLKGENFQFKKTSILILLNIPEELAVVSLEVAEELLATLFTIVFDAADPVCCWLPPKLVKLTEDTLEPPASEELVTEPLKWGIALSAGQPLPTLDPVVDPPDEMPLDDTSPSDPLVALPETAPGAAPGERSPGAALGSAPTPPDLTLDPGEPPWFPTPEKLPPAMLKYIKVEGLIPGKLKFTFCWDCWNLSLYLRAFLQL